MKKIILILLLSVSFISFGQERLLLFTGNQQKDYVLDNHPAQFAFSLSRLSSQTTNCIRARRNSTFEQRDFTPEEVINGTLVTWANEGANTGATAVKLYDQTGNGRHYTYLTNFTDTVCTTALITDTFGNPEIIMAGSELNANFDFADTLPALTGTNGSVFTNVDRAANGNSMWISGSGSSIGGVMQSASTAVSASLLGNPHYFKNDSWLGVRTRGELYRDFQTETSLGNNIAIIMDVNWSASAVWESDFYINSYSVGGFSSRNDMTFLIAYNNDVSADRLEITNALNEQFGIFTVDADAQAYIDAVGTLTDQQKARVIGFVKGCKQDGIWDELEALWFLDMGTYAKSKFNLINPLDTDVAYRLTDGGGNTWGATGVSGNSSTNFINTHVVPNTFAYATFAWGINLASEGRDTGTDMGTRVSGTNTMQIVSAWTSPDRYYVSWGLEPDNQVNAPNATSISDGVWLALSESATSHKVMREGVLLNSNTFDATTSWANLNLPIYIGAKNSETGARENSNRLYSVAFVATNLTEAESVLLYNRIRQYRLQ